MYVVLLALTYKQVENNVRSTASNDIQTSKTMYLVLLAMTYKQVENNVLSTASNDIQTSRKQCM